MGCGASIIDPEKQKSTVQNVSKFSIKKVLGKRKDSNVSSTSSAAFDFRPPMDQQMKALCFANVRSLFQRKDDMVIGVPRSNARRRRTVDARFIEQRVVRQNSDEESVDDGATNKTESTTLTRSTLESGKREDVVKREGDQPKTFFRIAMDYNKRMDSIKNFKPKKSIIQPTPVIPCKTQHKETFQRLNEPAAIVQHVSRREFLETSSCIATPPPVIRRNITPTNGSIRGSRETLLSERSFIVVHNTLRVAWEKEMCYERIQEVQRQNRLKQSRLRWHSVDSSCAETTSSDSTMTGEITPPPFGTNRIEWSRELDQIVRLD